jgi:hypothetical protein
LNTGLFVFIRIFTFYAQKGYTKGVGLTEIILEEAHAYFCRLICIHPFLPVQLSLHLRYLSLRISSPFACAAYTACLPTCPIQADRRERVEPNKTTAKKHGTLPIYLFYGFSRKNCTDMVVNSKNCGVPA